MFSDTFEINVLHRRLSSSNGGATTPRPVAQTPVGPAQPQRRPPRGSDDNALPLRIPLRVCHLLKDLDEGPYKTQHAGAA